MASLVSNRRAWPVVRSPTNIWKFIINLPGVMVLTAVTAVVGGDAAWQVAQAQAVTSIDARVIAENIPGASAISQVGTFIPGRPTPFGQCTLPHPIPGFSNGDFINQLRGSHFSRCRVLFRDLRRNPS